MGILKLLKKKKCVVLATELLKDIEKLENMKDKSGIISGKDVTEEDVFAKGFEKDEALFRGFPSWLKSLLKPSFTVAIPMFVYSINGTGHKYNITAELSSSISKRCDIVRNNMQYTFGIDIRVDSPDGPYSTYDKRKVLSYLTDSLKSPEIQENLQVFNAYMDKDSDVFNLSLKIVFPDFEFSSM